MGLILPGISWTCGEVELYWNRVEIGGHGSRLWWTAKGRVWAPRSARHAGIVKVRSGAYCIDAAKRGMTGGQQRSLQKYLGALDLSRLPF